MDLKFYSWSLIAAFAVATAWGQDGFSLISVANLVLTVDGVPANSVAVDIQ